MLDDVGRQEWGKSGARVGQEWATSRSRVERELGDECAIDLVTAVLRFAHIDAAKGDEAAARWLADIASAALPVSRRASVRMNGSAKKPTSQEAP